MLRAATWDEETMLRMIENTTRTLEALDHIGQAKRGSYLKGGLFYIACKKLVRQDSELSYNDVLIELYKRFSEAVRSERSSLSTLLKSIENMQGEGVDCTELSRSASFSAEHPDKKS